MTITLTLDKINVHSDGCCTLSDEILEKLAANGILRRRRIFYKLFLNNRELQLECPLLKNPEKKNVVLWPAIKLPYRKYPVYIYLYGVALYLSSDLSMREVAAKVRDLFGLANFSHSTISRSLKKLAGVVMELFALMATDLSKYISCKDSFVIRKHWDVIRQDNHRMLLHILKPVLNKLQTVEYGSLLNYRYFNKFTKFVI